MSHRRVQERTLFMFTQYDAATNSSEKSPSDSRRKVLKVGRHTASILPSWKCRRAVNTSLWFPNRSGTWSCQCLRTCAALVGLFLVPPAPRNAPSNEGTLIPGGTAGLSLRGAPLLLVRAGVAHVWKSPKQGLLHLPFLLIGRL